MFFLRRRVKATRERAGTPEHAGCACTRLGGARPRQAEGGPSCGAAPELLTSRPAFSSSRAGGDHGSTGRGNLSEDGKSSCFIPCLGWCVSSRACFSHACDASLFVPVDRSALLSYSSGPDHSSSFTGQLKLKTGYAGRSHHK